MELVTVRVRDCACPETPHEQDEVYLRPVLGLVGGLEAQRENASALNDAIRQVIGVEPSEDDFAQVQEEGSYLNRRTAEVMNQLLVDRWKPVFIRHGAVGWNFCDERGARPFDVSVLLDDFTLGSIVADAAADLYAEALMRPLVERLGTLSEPSPTAPTPKARRPGRTSTPKRRSSSSRRASAGTQ
jgi:hypothetical protein